MQTKVVNLNQGRAHQAAEAAEPAAMPEQQLKLADIQQPELVDPASGEQLQPISEQEKAELKLKKKRKISEKAKSPAADAGSDLADNDLSSDTAAQHNKQQASGANTQETQGAEHQPGNIKTAEQESNTKGAAYARDNINPVSGTETSSTASKQYAAANMQTAGASSNYVGMSSGAGSVAESAAISTALPTAGHASTVMSGWVLAGVALAGIGAAAGAGGSGPKLVTGSSSGGGHSITGIPTLPEASQTTISGEVMVGPVFAMSGLSVKAYALDGRELGSAAVDDEGRYSMALPKAYQGLVRVRVIDGNGNAHDYMDQATHAGKDIGDLSALGIIKAGQANSIMITPLTDVAANKLVGTAVTESEVLAANQAVADLFGIDNILTTVPIPVITQSGDDNLGNANTYGKVLAVLSVAEKISADPEAGPQILNIIGAALPDGTANSVNAKAAKDMLLDALQDASSNGLLDAATRAVLEHQLMLALSPAALAVELSYDTGLAGDKISSDATLIVSGVVSGNSWEYSLDGGSTWMPGSGSILPASAFASDGAKSVLVRQMDFTGNFSPVPPAYDFTLDSTAPADPSINLKQDTGIANDKVSSNAELTLTGMEPGVNWEYSLDNGNTWKIGSGDSIPASEFGDDGDKHVQVRQTDVAGNVAISAAYEFSLDTAKPDAPAVVLSNDSGSSDSDGLTNHAELTVSGLEAGAAWEYSLDAGITWNAGTGSKIPASVFNSDGEKSVQLRQTDIAGNTSDVSLPYDFTLDTTAPSLTVTISTVAGDDVINKTEAAPHQDVHIEGSATGARPGDKVTATIDGSDYTDTLDYSGTIDEDGSTFSIVVPGEVLANLADKKIIVSLSSTDDAGNTATVLSAEKTYTVNLTAAAPIISLDDLTADNILNIAEAAGDITLTGTVGGDAQAGDKVTITLGGKTYETTVSNNNGSLEFSQVVPGSELKNHTSVSAMVESHNGSNTGSASVNLDYVVDIEAPQPRVTVEQIAGDDIVNSNESTHNVDIIGRVEGARAGDTVKTSLNSHEYSATVEADGSFSISVPGSVLVALAEKEVVVSVVATDHAGNQATASGAKTYQVDTANPAAPSVTLTADSGSSNTDNLTNKAGLTVSGLEKGARWEYSLDNGNIWHAGVGSSIAAGVFANDGVKSVRVRQSDIAGNISAASPAYTFTLDTTAPAPSITTQSGQDDYVNANETGVDLEISYSNMAAGDVIQLRNDNIKIGAAHTVTAAELGTGKAMIHVSASFLDEGRNAISALVTDKAGNSGTSASKYYTLDTIAPEPSISLDDVTSDNILDASEASGDVTISGTVGGDAQVGDLVTVTVGHNTYHATVLSDHSFRVAVPGSVLLTSRSVSAEVSSSDLAGNIATQSASLSYALGFALDLNGTAAGINRQVNARTIATPVQIMTDAALIHADDNTKYKSVDLKISGVAASSDDQLMSGASSQAMTALPTSGSATLTVTGASGSTVWTVLRSGSHYSFVLQDGSSLASKAQVQELLTSLYVSNSSNYPLQGERRYEIVVTDAQDSTGSAYSSLTLDSVAPVVDLNGSNITGNNTSLAMTPGPLAYALVSSQTLIQEAGRISRITVQASSGVAGALDSASSSKAETVGLSDGSDANGMSASLRIGQAGSLQNSSLISGVKLLLTMASNGSLTITAENTTLTQQQASQVLQALRYSADTSVVTGQRTFTVSVTDDSGNTGSSTSTVTVNPVGTPTIGLNSLSDSGLYDNDQVTAHNGSSDAASLMLSGTASPASTVDIFDDLNGNGVMDTGEALGTATANANGEWSFTLNNKGLSDGLHRISARVGTSVTSAVNVTIDTQAPADVLFMGSSVQVNPLLAGTSDANAKVRVALDTDGNPGNGYEVSYETITDNAGRWTLDTATATPVSGSSYTYAAGATVNVKVTTTDLAGNETVRTGTSTAQSSLYSISDSQVIEGSSGQREMVFIVTRSGDTADAGSVNFEIADGTSARSGGSGSLNDYAGAAAGKLEFAPGETSKTIKFTINGDYYREVNEKIVVNLTDPVNGNIADGVGVGLIAEIDVSKLQAAYSLRELNPQSNDFAIRVRRSSDNAEKDIGFDAHGDLDVNALLDFVGRGASDKGFVTTWYDQSVNNRHMTQTDPLMQGVIVDNGNLVTRADGSVAISFNNDRNGSNNDSMSATGEAASDWKSVIIYTKVQSEGVADGFLFNIGGLTGPSRLSANYPWEGQYYWDVNGLGNIARLKGPIGSQVDKANDIVVEAHSGVTTAGTQSLNYTDAAQMIFENGERVASDGTMKARIATTATWYLAQEGSNDHYQQAMYSEFLVYLAKDNSTPNVQALQGSAVNDVMTYSGESNITRIDGLGGNDALYISGATNLDVTTLAGGMFSIETIRMDNNTANTLTLNDASIIANGSSSLTMIMDAGDKVVFNGVNYNYSTDLQALVIGNAQNNIITSTNGNVRMIGGGGADTFTWLPGQTGHDTVQDYSVAQGDKLDLSSMLEGFTPGSESLFLKKAVGADGQVQVLVDVSGGNTFEPNLTITMTGLSASDAITIMTTNTNSYVL